MLATTITARLVSKNSAMRIIEVDLQNQRTL